MLYGNDDQRLRQAVPEPGKYVLSVEGTNHRQAVDVMALPGELKAGLRYMPMIKIEIEGVMR